MNKCKELAEKYDVEHVVEITVCINDKTGEKATAWFRKPGIDIFSAALAIQASDPFKAKAVILKGSFLEGDKKVIETETGLMNAALSVDAVINLQRGSIKKN